MKLRTRLITTFIMMMLMPLLLSTIAFVIVSSYVLDTENRKLGDYMPSGKSDMISNLATITDDAYLLLKEEIAEGESKIEDLAYLESVNEVLLENASYLIMYKGGTLYYLGRQGMIEEAWLEEYVSLQENEYKGYYFNNGRMCIKSLDYTFLDGSNGLILLVTEAKNHAQLKELIVDMIVVIILILLFSNYILARWMDKGIFIPIRELTAAMNAIAKGDLEHEIVTTTQGEVGELYHNYEQMRIKLRETEEEKIENDRHIRELISNISHDLKTPTTAIKGYVEGIIDGVADTPERREKYVKTIYCKANDMDRLINELNVYSKLDSNQVPYNYRILNVSAYFLDCAEEVELGLEGQEIDFYYENKVEEYVNIFADPEQIKRVINNIISNSIKYMNKAKGKISIRILDDGDMIRVEIEDNGIGIAAKDIDKIFERFYRTDSSRNSSRGGSGIGLSIVKKIMEDHGGYISATSKEREGTCIQIMMKKYRKVE